MRSSILATGFGRLGLRVLGLRGGGRRGGIADILGVDKQTSFLIEAMDYGVILDS